MKINGRPNGRAIVRIALAAVLAFALGASATGGADAFSSADIIPGRYIVSLREEASIDTVAARHGVVPDVVYEHALNGFAGSLSDEAASALEADPDVLSIEQDRIVRANPQTMPTGVNRIDVEENTTAAINGIDANGGEGLDLDIAIIDTGIDTDHPDLRVAGGRGFLGGSCASSSFEDDHFHGTHVAGTAAARDNGSGVVGVAPGARLWAAKVLDSSGSGSFSCVIKGVDWVTANAATIEVANMSLGGLAFGDPAGALCTAISRSTAAGVIHVVAAGNSSADAAAFTPANCDGAVTVSAIADFNGLPGGGSSSTCRSDQDDTFADFSNFGHDVDIAAPGVCIYSTWLGGGYGTISGTSMASPHVAGAVALFKLATGYSGSASGPSIVLAMKNAGWTIPQTSADCGFIGDPDGALFHEPLVYLGNTCQRSCPGDTDCDLVPDGLDNCPGAENLIQQDADLDGRGDACDNCPSTANAGQENTDATLEAAGASVIGDDMGDACDNDDDNDSGGAVANRTSGPCQGTSVPVFDDCVETYLGTNRLDNCILGPGSGGDAWPPDLGANGSVDTADIAVVTGDFGDAVPPAPARKDLTANGFIDTADIALLTGLFGDGCS